MTAERSRPTGAGPTDLDRTAGTADSDAAWIAQARAALDDDVASFDGNTLSRLNRARQAALAEAARPRRRVFGATGLAAAGATALVILLAVALKAPGPGSAPLDAPAAQDVELLSSEDTLEIYEDQEFYAWLDAQSQSSG